MVDHLLQSIPPLAVYLLVGIVIATESLGIPIPGEITLVSAALLSSRNELAVSPLWIAVAGSAGAIIGDSIGYSIGHRWGMPLFGWLGRKLPAHFGPPQVALAEHVFRNYGAWAVFFGRFLALLRIFAGPLAGALHMPYRTFLVANAAGGILWASATTLLVYQLGEVAEQWLSRFSWIGLGLAVAASLSIGLVIKHRTRRIAKQYADNNPAPVTDAD